MAGNHASVAAVTHQAAIFFSDAQVSKQQREEGGGDQDQGLWGQMEAWGRERKGSGRCQLSAAVGAGGRELLSIREWSSE